jgi:uncharacterized protein (UPF0305 family)
MCPEESADDRHPTEKDAAVKLFREVIARLNRADTKGSLGRILADEVTKFTLFDLQIIGGRLKVEVDHLPMPYREAIRPFFINQVFGMHHRLLVLSRSGAFDRMTAPLTNPEVFSEFCQMVPEGCFAWDDSSDRNPHFSDPKYRLFYYLISAFTMFVLDEPGHPVGMPFPGGFYVEERKGSYYCLIRDREKEVFYSICNFCPAKQSDDATAQKNR